MNENMKYEKTFRHTITKWPRIVFGDGEKKSIDLLHNTIDAHVHVDKHSTCILYTYIFQSTSKNSIATPHTRIVTVTYSMTIV